jgi:hypothetical protein
MTASVNTAGVIASASSPLARILARLGTIPGSLWFDPGWDAGITRQLDGATWRITSITSRVTAYTISQGVLGLAPAEAFGPNGRRILSCAGAQFLSGAATLAALLQGSASYSEIQIGIRTSTANTFRWLASLNTASSDDRVGHYVSAANVTNRTRTAAGLQTQNTGSSVTNSVPLLYTNTYNGSVYSGWLNSTSETLSGSGSNTRAPISLDIFDLCCQRSLGVPTNFWVGSLTGLIITPGHVLSTTNRVALESDLSDYYGY